MKQLLAFAMVTLLSSCALIGKGKPEDMREDLLVSSSWLEEHLDDGNIVVLHVASDVSSYNTAHIRGARFLDSDEMLVTRDGIPNELPDAGQLEALIRSLGIDNDDRVVVYGEGKGLWAARAYLTLDYLGHGERTALLDGQFEKWRREDRPINNTEPEFSPSLFTANVQQNIVVAQEEMERIVAEEQSSTLIVDARPPAQYTGEVPGEGVKRAGHIPGAVNIYWENTIRSGDVPRLKSPSDLADMFSPEKETTITYCRTGGQGSFAYFVAKYLGHETRIYDGSYYAWNLQPDTEVVKE